MNSYLVILKDNKIISIIEGVDGGRGGGGVRNPGVRGRELGVREAGTGSWGGGDRE